MFSAIFYCRPTNATPPIRLNVRIVKNNTLFVLVSQIRKIRGVGPRKGCGYDGGRHCPCESTRPACRFPSGRFPLGVTALPITERHEAEHEEPLRRVLDGRWSVEEEQEHVTAWGLTRTDLSVSECVHTAALTLPNQYSPALVRESGSRRGWYISAPVFPGSTSPETAAPPTAPDRRWSKRTPRKFNELLHYYGGLSCYDQNVR